MWEAKFPKNNKICCAQLLNRQVRVPRYMNFMKDLYNNILDFNRKANSYGSQEILLFLKIGQPAHQMTLELVKTVLI